MTGRPMLPRRTTIPVRVRNVTVGGGHPVVVQSMTNTDTADAAGTAQQVLDLFRAGSEIVRITVNNKEAAAAVPEIRARLDDAGADVPLCGDFHYNGHVLLRAFPDCADALDKYRINPGNVGKGPQHDQNFATMIECAKDHQKPVRIGVNAGSLDQAVLARLMDQNAAAGSPKTAEQILLDAMVTSAVESAEAAVGLGLPEDRIVISCKISKVQQLIAVYRQLADATRHALHLGLTEAQQPRIDKDTGELVADRLMQQNRRHRRINPARQDADHPTAANLGADLGDRLIAKRGHRPIAATTGDPVGEIAQQFGAVGGVHHLGVELHRVEPARVIGDHRVGRAVRHRHRAEPGRQLGDPVAVAHPHRLAAALVPDSVE